MIPPFDHNLVLPPHNGTPVNINDLSPYPCTTLELCKHFGTTPERIEILNGLLRFRKELRKHGLLNGFQWLDGSFLENIEVQENRPPNDLDVVTIYWGYDIPFQIDLNNKVPFFADSRLSKMMFKLDHYIIDASASPQKTVEIVRYWSQLFSHNRNGVWKGMLSIQLNTAIDDLNALMYLQSL